MRRETDWTVAGISILGIMFWLAAVRPEPVRNAMQGVQTFVEQNLLSSRR